MKKKTIFSFPVISAIIVLSIGLSIALVAIYLDNKSKVEENDIVIPQSASITSTLEYDSRAGPEVIYVKVSLENSVIKDLEVEHEPNNPVSIGYQKKFSEKVNEFVVGKKITDEFEESAINGASVTSEAFWMALSEIHNKFTEGKYD